MIKIDVTPFLDEARELAEGRQQRRTGSRLSCGRPGVKSNTWGVLGEMAVAQYLGLEHCARRTWAEERAAHFDIAGIQVRTRSWHKAPLGLRDRDCTECIYVVVVPVRVNVVGLAGAIRGTLDVRQQAGKPGFVDGRDGPIPIVWISQDRLRPVPETPPAAFYAGHALRVAA